MSEEPIVITITAYNKTVIANGFGSTLAGADPAYLVKRGYAQLTVDARGTGSSEGSWCAFCTRENKDAAEVVTWAAGQPITSAAGSGTSSPRRRRRPSARSCTGRWPGAAPTPSKRTRP